MFREAPIDKKGQFDYVEFTRILKHGAKDKDDQQSISTTIWDQSISLAKNDEIIPDIFFPKKI